MCGYAMIIEEWARSDVGFHAVGRRQKLTALVIQSWPHKSAQADKVVRVLRTGSKIDHLDSRLRSPACGRGARGTASRKSPVSERRAFLAGHLRCSGGARERGKPRAPARPGGLRRLERFRIRRNPKAALDLVLSHFLDANRSPHRLKMRWAASRASPRARLLPSAVKP